ncbi:hypothetical protein IP92_02007 [Pseudoduganella flava]|uniref:Uncharacterized protein n=1 Tax=Pseudoduganella flava TaxID=871742 RepID=A0A562PW11_9BURK|nr:hypothetical protein [Pseudoduganella flava]QGZ39705.1 hypothetical protein GO485_12035 [Pseudoduganella flava]TWI48615.1 hypothetical protein IP92_02007 [Pseudoduganella flava]
MHGLTLKRLLASAAITLALSACGGGGGGDSSGPPPSGGGSTALTASASVPYALAGGGAVTLTAAVSDGTSVSWQLAAGSPGTLSGATGTSVTYLPPADGVAAAMPVTVTATAGAASKSVNLTLYPDPGPARLQIIAGDDGGIGLIDGRRTAARFGLIREIAMDSSGGLLVAEDAALRRVTSDGAVTTLTPDAGAISVAPSQAGYAVYAQRDVALGTVKVRQLNADVTPPTLATLSLAQADTFHLYGTPTGKLYGAQHERIVQIFEPAGGTATLAGVVTGDSNALPVDGPAGVARFRAISAIAGDIQGNLYVIDDTLIRKVTPDGTVTTLAGALGSSALPQDGQGNAARFLAPFSLAVDVQGNVLVLDRLSGSTDLLLRKVTPEGVVISVRVADAGLRQIVGNGGVSVKAARTAQIDVLNADGTTTAFAGKEPATPGTVNGTGTAARFNANIYLMAADPSGNLYVVDSQPKDSSGTDVPGLTLRKVTPDGVTTTFATSAAVHVPTGIVADKTGNLYVSDRQVTGPANPPAGGGAIYKITPRGTVAVLAGSGDKADVQVDGTGSAARFVVPTLVGIDADGNLYATDRKTAGGTGVGIPIPVRKITPQGVVTTVAALPPGLRDVADAAGNLYSADVAQSVVYRTTPAGVQSVIAGVAGKPITYAGLPGYLNHPQALVATGPFSFALLSGSTVVRLVVPH